MQEPEYIGNTVQEMMRSYLDQVRLREESEYDTLGLWFRKRQERYDELAGLPVKCRALDSFRRWGNHHCNNLACPSCWYRTQSKLLTRFVAMDYPYYVLRRSAAFKLWEEIDEDVLRRITEPRCWKLGFYTRYVTVCEGTNHSICSLSGIEDRKQFMKLSDPEPTLIKPFKRYDITDELFDSKDDTLRAWTQECEPCWVLLQDNYDHNDRYGAVIEAFSEIKNWSRLGRTSGSTVNIDTTSDMDSDHCLNLQY